MFFSVQLKPDTLWVVVLVSREGEKIESWVSVPTFSTEVHIPLDCWSTSWEVSSRSASAVASGEHEYPASPGSPTAVDCDCFHSDTADP